MSIKNNDNFNQWVVSILKNRYGGFLFCYFYGSASTGKNSKLSDIDLIIICVDTIQPFREKFSIDGSIFDVFVYDLESLNGHLHSARNHGQFVTVDAVIESITLPFENQDSILLKNIAKRVKKSGFLFKNRQFVQQFITGILDDLIDCDNSSERIRLCIALFTQIIDVYLIGSGYGICSRKFAARALANVDIDFQKDLDLALIKGIDGFPSDLILIANSVLIQIGGELRDGFRQNIDVMRMPLPVL